MNILPKEISDGLTKGRCYDFITERAADALEQILTDIPEARRYLTDEAGECLKKNYFERLELIYSQCLLGEIRKLMEKIDPVGLMLGKFKEESVQKAAEELYSSCDGRIGEHLHDKYPLLEGYRDHIHKNYLDFFREFLRAFLKDMDTISVRFLEGRKINKIEHFSAGGADIHRNGRCVIGTRTDAGTVYYKPHDCGLDILFHEIVSRWFSDCTVAADVIEGDGYAFVSCLKHEALGRAEDAADYYYHFGILAALFHGLGSNDMHQENIISCGDRPACVDVETILGTAVRKSDEAGLNATQAKRVFTESLTRTCLLPMRIYKGPIISPLYTNDESKLCLPEHDGRTYTGEGHVDEFKRGFGEGYKRMLSHRDEIKTLIEQYSDSTVRCLLKNTRFYAHIRLMMFRPDYLKDEEARKKLYDKFSAPFKDAEDKIDYDIIDYEWSCMLKGDIPYYCTTVAGKELCGEQPGQVVKDDYYAVSVGESAVHFLDRLSEREERFEQEMISLSFEHAPVDEPKEKEQAVIGEEVISGDTITDELSSMIEDIISDRLQGTDDRYYWISTAFAMDAAMTCGDMLQFADIGHFCTSILTSDLPDDLKDKAKGLAEQMCDQIAEELSQTEGIGDDIKKANTVLPVGIYTGFGGLLLSCSGMADAGIDGAASLCGRILDIVFDHEFWLCKKTNIAEGIAGLVIGASSLGQSEKRDRVISACAERLLKEELPTRSDLPYGRAGIGAALAAAYRAIGDERYAAGAIEVFGKVKEDYDAKLKGWPDGNAKIRWMADRGPHSAGIYLASSYACDILDGQPGTGVIKEIMDLSSDSMQEETRLYRLDALDQGNGLTVLAYLRAGNTDQAGRILASMVGRKHEKGRFIVTPKGIRSPFDASFYLGTVGIGSVMTEYTTALSSCIL